MTSIFKLIGAVIFMSLSAACVSSNSHNYEGDPTVQKSETVQADSLCASVGEDKLMVINVATNPLGPDNANHSGMLVIEGKEDCSGLARDELGNIKDATLVAAANTVDYARDLGNGFVGVVGGAFNGAVGSALVANADQGCAGCVPQVTNVTAVAQQTTEVANGLTANLANGGPPPCNGCGAAKMD